MYNVKRAGFAAMSDGSAESSGEVIALGQIDVKASVSVTFELE